jgi:mannose-6-phosphate isomerase
MTGHVRRKANRLSQLELTPLTFHPVFKDYPWGGRNLEAKLGRAIPEGIVAESWEIAGHDHGSTAVRHGPHMGRLLSELMDEWGADLVGIRSAAALKLGRFPLLIKILDAHRWLSVQVHPDDEYSLANEGDFGKTEMWVVLHAEPGSELIYGFKPGVTAASYADALGADRAADELHRLRVHQGASSSPRSSRTVTPRTASTTGDGLGRSMSRRRSTF